jgi:hypothetical protein
MTIKKDFHCTRAKVNDAVIPNAGFKTGGFALALMEAASFCYPELAEGQQKIQRTAGKSSLRKLVESKVHQNRTGF